MKINFSTLTVRELVEVAGSLTYIQLVALAKEHGISAKDTYEQLTQEVEKGTVRRYLGKPGSSALYQDTRRTVSKPTMKATDQETNQVLNFLVKEFRHKKFRAGDVAKAMTSQGFRWYDGEDEKPWVKEKVQPCLRELAKRTQLIAGKISSMGQYFWFPDWKPKEKT